MRMRLLGIPVGLILLFMGSVWFLQGIGVLPGSFMTGSSFWAAAGALAVIVGLVLIVVGMSGRKPPTQPP
ncbi:MAG: hypothetical protein ABSF63_02565 [Candidatus Bathyarchaeia archaeon]